MAERPNRVIIAGASVRSAAWSALRAGLEPICVDLFADCDLRRLAAVQTVAAADYPDGLVRIFEGLPAVPWLYTGALENRPRLIERLSRSRPLWGNGPSVLRKVRSPFLVAESLRKAGLPCPAVRRLPPESENGRRWLRKPRRGAGGRGIAFFESAAQARDETIFFQEWIDGDPCAALYLGCSDDRTCFLGATRQLIGLPWLNARPFQYCGSVGPLSLTVSVAEHFQRLGNVLTRDFGLRGLFGVDCVMHDGVPWPVEVNPRYTASTEIVEWGLGRPLLTEHAKTFGLTRDVGSEAKRRDGMLAKAVLFASDFAEFPESGPWCATLAEPWQPWKMPRFADIPAAGHRIQAGEPILTIFASGQSLDECLDALRQTTTACGFAQR